MPNFAFAVEEMSEKEIMDAIENSENAVPESSMYINDIEILGANIIKPEYILNKLTLKKGDLYDKEIMQSKWK